MCRVSTTMEARDGFQALQDEFMRYVGVTPKCERLRNLISYCKAGAFPVFLGSFIVHLGSFDLGVAHTFLNRFNGAIILHGLGDKSCPG